MKTKILKRFKDVEKGSSWNNFKKYSSISIYDTLDENSFNYITQNLSKIPAQTIEITFDINNKRLLKQATELNFFPIYHWYIFYVSPTQKQLETDSNISALKRRRLVKKQLTDQVHELAKREPNMFDKNGEEKNWYKAGKKCFVYKLNNKIISILTWQYEPQNNNIHIYLTYTLPEYRSQGYNSKLFNHIKNYASEKGIKTITVCTDVTKNNPVPNMFYKN